VSSAEAASFFCRNAYSSKRLKTFAQKGHDGLSLRKCYTLRSPFGLVVQTESYANHFASLLWSPDALETLSEIWALCFP
jgi:hypothetical protein